MNFINQTLMSLEPTARPQVDSMLRVMANAEHPQAGEADDARRSGLPIRMRGKTAVVSLEGPILKPEWVQYWGFASSRAFQRAVEAAVADATAEQIVLAIDTPGGSVDGLAEAADAVHEAAKIKPVIGQVVGMMASAGYYIGSQATKIFAQRMDMIGSLGTRTMLYDWSRAFENEGIKAIPIDTAPKDRPHKSAGAAGTPITEVQQAEFQRIVDDYGRDFRAMIARGRSMNDEQIGKIFDGRIWTASDALDLGLIDGIQTMDQTLAELTSTEKQSQQDRTAKHKLELRSRELCNLG